MNLDDHELRDLADFLSRRFPASVDRAALAVAARVPIPEDDSDERWRAVVWWAQDRGTLPRMIAMAWRMRPDDPKLAEMAALLPSTRRWPWVVATLFLLAGAGAVWMGRGTPLVAAVPPAPTTSAARTAPPGPPASPAPARGADAPAAEPPPPAAPEAAPAPLPLPASASATPTTGRCAAANGALLGYWYAGGSAPGEAGQIYSMKGGATVRADYPRPENHYQAHAEIRCGLVAGDQIRLTQAPIPVSGGVWWVPFLGGDLVLP